MTPRPPSPSQASLVNREYKLQLRQGQQLKGFAQRARPLPPFANSTQEDQRYACGQCIPNAIPSSQKVSLRSVGLDAPQLPTVLEVSPGPGDWKNTAFHRSPSSSGRPNPRTIAERGEVRPKPSRRTTPQQKRFDQSSPGIVSELADYSPVCTGNREVSRFDSLCRVSCQGK